MKRAISLSFLLLAGIVVLAHAVIPHHHHDGIPIFVAHDEQDDNLPNHDKNKCWLSLIVKKRLGNDRQTCHLLDCDFDLFTLLYDDTILLIKNDVDILPEHHPSFHTEFIIRSTGLRAPPVC
jgi:hypothetical protein